VNPKYNAANSAVVMGLVAKPGPANLFVPRYKGQNGLYYSHDGGQNHASRANNFSVH